jgi:hypothetical protein
VTDGRFVVAGLAHVRSAWFTEVARWATAGSLPVEFVKCLSVEELRARTGSGRPFSAALVDGRLPAVDRDLLAELSSRDIPALVVVAGPDAGGNGRDWPALGATTTITAPLERNALLDALVAHGRPVSAVDHDPVEPPTTTPSATWRGRLVAVIGRPGAGTSTVAAALAQRLADDPRYAGDVLVADFARHAHQALLHDARDVVPGVQELVEAHRSGRPGPDQLRRLTFDVPVRRYRLLLGLRRPRDWVTIRPRAFATALDGLRRATRVVVADTDADLEGEAETGSLDLEDRNVMARTTVTQADLVVAVTTPTLTGLHGLVRLLDDLRGLGTEGARTLVVCTRAPRSARARAEVTRAVADLTGAADRPDPHLGPVYVPERRGVDTLHRDLARFPGALADPPGRAAADVLDRLPRRLDLEVAPGPEPVPVAPGSLGRWADDADVGDDGPGAERRAP